MNERSDFDSVLRAWFDDGPTVMADRVFDGLTVRIAREPQQRSWRLPWRLRPVNRTITYAAGLVAVLLVAVVGVALVPGSGALPTPTPPPPTNLASPALPVLHNGSLPAGRYRVAPFASQVLELTLPAGWSGVAESWLESPNGLAAPGGLGIAFLKPNGLFSDPCHWDVAGTGVWPQPPDVAVGPTAVDLATALAKQTAYTATPVTDITVGGYPGKRLDLTLPAGLDPKTCDRSTEMDFGTYMPFGPSDAGGTNLYAQGPAQTWHLWIVEVASTRWVIVVNDYAGTPPATYAAAEAIVASIRFTP